MSDPTLLDSEIDNISNQFRLADRLRGENQRDFELAKAKQLIKALIATTVNEVITSDIPIDDHFAEAIDDLTPTDMIKVVKLVHKAQKAKLQELINGK